TPVVAIATEGPATHRQVGATAGEIELLRHEGDHRHRRWAIRVQDTARPGGVEGDRRLAVLPDRADEEVRVALPRRAMVLDGEVQLEAAGGVEVGEQVGDAPPPTGREPGEQARAIGTHERLELELA